MRKETGKPSLARRIIASMCSLALGAALVPAVSFTALAADQEEETVLTVSIEDATTGAKSTPKGSTYTQADLEKLAADNKDTLNYLNAMKKGRVDTTSSYVTIDQLIGDFAKWAEGSTLVVTASDGLEVTKTYEEVAAESYYFPNYDAASKSDSGKVAVPYILALTSASTAIGDGTAADAAAQNAAAEPKDAKRQLLYGLADANPDNWPTGKGYPSDVASITVKYPHKDFTIYAQETDAEGKATGDVAELKEYKDADLSAIAQTTPVNYILANAVYSSSKFVTISQLLEDYNCWKPGSSITAVAPDGFSTTVSYEDATAPAYFFPNYTSKEASEADKVEVEPAIIFNWTSGKLGTDGETAAEVATSNASKAPYDGNRFIRGNATAAELLQGKSSPADVESITINYQVSDMTKATVEVEDQAFTGKALTPNATVKIGDQELTKDVDYTIEYKNNTKAGTATVTVTGIDSYKGTATGKFKISGLAKGKTVTKGTAKYTVTGKSTVTYKAATKKTATSVKVPATVKLADGKTYKVTTIKAKAFKSMSKLTKVTIGKNVKKIEAKAFYKTPKLKTITVKSTKLSKKSSVKGALKGSKAKALTVKAPKAKKAAYKKSFTKKNLSAPKAVTVK